MRSKLNIGLYCSRCAVTLMTSKMHCAEAVAVFNMALE